MFTREKLLALLNETGLSDYAERLLDKAQSTIHLKLQKVQDETEIPLGHSKAGGSPDLLPGMEWPHWHDKPLTFMMQFCLSDVAPFDVENLLPHQGMLYFFYDVDGLPWGFDPAWRGSSRVLFIDPESKLLCRTPHLTAPGENGEIGPLPACKIAFSSSLSLPPYGHPEIDTLGLGEDHLDRYWKLLLSIRELARPQHHLLGYPEQIQGDMQLECQLASHGLYVGRAEDYRNPRRYELEPGAKDWRLLLQIDTDELCLDVMWGDDGMIYYWIQAPALQARNFDNCWHVLQCY